jgi:hypothetical protein
MMNAIRFKKCQPLHNKVGETRADQQDKHLIVNILKENVSSNASCIERVIGRGVHDIKERR